jgi:membrane protease YdiL (CAAX protease family)
MWLTNSNEDEAFWNYRDVALFLGLAVPCLLGGALVVKIALMALYIGGTHKALELLPGQFIGYALLYAALAFIFRFEYERPFWRSLGWLRPAVRIPSIVVLGSAMAFVIAMLGALLRTPEVPGPMRELLSDRASLVAVAIAGVTVGPLCEELAFRGFLQPLFVRSLGAAPGIFLAALGFGLLHLPQYGYDWQHGLLLTLAGAGFGWMRWISRSTLGSTIMHSAYNLTLFLGFFAAGSKVPQSW